MLAGEVRLIILITPALPFKQVQSRMIPFKIRFHHIKRSRQVHFPLAEHINEWELSFAIATDSEGYHAGEPISDYQFSQILCTSLVL